MPLKTVLITIGRCAYLVMLVALTVTFIRRKRAGQWKRPKTFPLAMILLAIAFVGVGLALLGK